MEAVDLYSILSGDACATFTYKDAWARPVFFTPLSEGKWEKLAVRHYQASDREVTPFLY